MKKAYRFGLSPSLVAAALCIAAVVCFGCPPAHESSSVAVTDNNPDHYADLPAGSLGSRDNPVKCDSPRGQMAYLDRLRGPDGQPPRYVRAGNLGQGVNGNIVDLYLVESQDGSVRVKVIMDMYFRGYVEKNSIEGFTIEG